MQEIKIDKNKYKYKVDGKVVAKITLEVKDDSVEINQLTVLPEYRRKKIGTKIVQLWLEKGYSLYGFTLTPHGAKFWGQFDYEIPLNLNDEELEEWCNSYGHFSINKDFSDCDLFLRRTVTKLVKFDKDKLIYATELIKQKRKELERGE